MQGNLVILLAATEFRDPLLPLWAMELLANVFLWVWLFCMGATVGSFLNVVVYRLPRGLNLAYPGSFCPHCGHAIRLQDNIPLLSWLALRGRCRDCAGRISPRYFFVELTVAVAFLVVLAAEYYLPAAAVGFRARHLLQVRDGVPFWCMYAMHLTLVSTLLAALLIMADDFPVTAKIYVPVLIVGFVVPLIWPEVRSIPAFSYRGLARWQEGLIDGLVGMAAGWAMAMAIIVLTLTGRGPRPKPGPIALACSLGVVLGWQLTMVFWPLVVVGGLLISLGLRAITVALYGPTADPSSLLTGWPSEQNSGPINAPGKEVNDQESISEDGHVVNPPSERAEPS